MNPELIDLIPNRLLLDSNFDGYKLSLEQIQQNKRDLQTSIDRVLINNYSYLHTKLYGLHNHLVGETIDKNDSVYFVDKNWNICKTYKDPFVGELIEPITVWKIPKRRDKNSNDNNISFKFINNQNIAVLSDGMGMLYILNTGSRSNDDYFSVLYSDEVMPEAKSFIILDSVFKAYDEGFDELHILLLDIQQEKETLKYLTVLNWITLNRTNDTDQKWGQIALRELVSKGDVQYAYLDRNCNAIYVVSENGCTFTINSDCPVITPDITNSIKKIYQWNQNLEEINIKLHLVENFDKTLVRVNTSSTSIEVKYNETNAIVGTLYQRIDADLTTWDIKNGILEICLSKSEEGMWPEFVIGDNTGELVQDSCYVEEVHNRLAHLSSNEEASPQNGSTFNSSQVEECDYETDKSLVFERIQSSTNKITHKTHLGSRQILLTAQLNQDFPPALGIRHDVDVCLWQPQELSNNFKIVHEGTLLAFGYVQASKQQRKFSVCSPDVSFSAICESTRHIFIYRQKKAVESGELRNRCSGRAIRNIAQQQVVSLPNEEILGIYVSNSNIFLLGETFVMVLIVQSE